MAEHHFQPVFQGCGCQSTMCRILEESAVRWDEGCVGTRGRTSYHREVQDERSTMCAQSAHTRSTRSTAPATSTGAITGTAIAVQRQGSPNALIDRGRHSRPPCWSVILEGAAELTASRLDLIRSRCDVLFHGLRTSFTALRDCWSAYVYARPGYVHDAFVFLFLFLVRASVRVLLLFCG